MCWRCDCDAFDAGLCLSCYEKSRASAGELEARLRDAQLGRTQAEELNADLLKARDGQTRALLAAIAELGLVRAELTDKDAELAERDAALRGRDAELTQRDAALREAREIIAQLRGVRGLVDFGSSEFKREYDRARQPEFQDQLLAAVREVVFDYAESKGLPHAETVVFLQQLQSEWSLTDPVGKAVQRVWTSAKRLGGTEFCSMYNSTTRCDRAARASAVLARALNINLVTCGGAGAAGCAARAGCGRAKHVDAGVCVLARWRVQGYAGDSRVLCGRKGVPHPAALVVILRSRRRKTLHRARSLGRRRQRLHPLEDLHRSRPRL